MRAIFRETRTADHTARARECGDERAWGARRRRAAGALLLPLLLLTPAGCPYLSPAQLEAGLEQMQLLGRTGDALLLGKSDFPRSSFSLASLLGGDVPMGVLRIVSMDLNTLAITPLPDRSADDSLDDLIGPYAGIAPVLTSPTWEARVDPAAGGILVRNRLTGAEVRHFEGVAGPDLLRPAALDGDRLAAALFRPAGGDGVLLVIDLLTGESRIVGRILHSYSGGDVALAGDLVAFWSPPAFDPAVDPVGDFLDPDELVLLNLATGERRSIAAAPPLATRLHSAFVDGRLVWLKQTLEALRIGRYDPATQTAEPPLTIAESASADRLIEVLEFNARALLWMYVEDGGSDFAPPGGRVTVTLQLFDGRSVVLVDNAPLDTFGLYGVSVAVLTDRYAIVSDPGADDLIVYDLHTGETQRLRPFAG